MSMFWPEVPVRLLRYAAVIVTIFGIAACAREDAQSVVAEAKKIEGSVIYRERTALPAGAVVTVQLEDISLPDAPATVMSTVTMQPQGGPPYPFSIDYESESIDETRLYALRASIRFDNRLLFSSTEFIDAFGGNPVTVLVQRVPEPIISAE